MQYETIILELMARIKKLEEEVAMLKEAVGSFDNQDEREAVSDETGETSEEVKALIKK